MYLHADDRRTILRPLLPLCSDACYAVLRLASSYLVSRLVASGIASCSSSLNSARRSGLQDILRLSASCADIQGRAGDTKHAVWVMHGMQCEGD